MVETQSPEVEEAPADGGDITPPEQAAWWAFQSKEAASEWANKIVETRLARERKKFDPIVTERDTLKSEVERLKPLEDASKTDAERWESEKKQFAEELDELRSFKSETERVNLIRGIAEEKGLPSKFIARVQGSTPEEITADIDDLVNVLEDGKPKKPAARQPKETDGDKPGDKGYSGAGGDTEGDDAVKNRILKKYRENRNSYSL